MLTHLSSLFWYWPITTHTHTQRLTALCPGLPGWAGTRKVKPIWILLKQETVSGSGISWATCKSAPRSRQITMPVPHHSVFLQAGCPSCRPTNSVKALKALLTYHHALLTFSSCLNKELMRLARKLYMLCCFIAFGAYTRSFSEFVGEPQ